MNALPAFVFALTLGNLLAIGVHAFCWWLRKWSQARLVMAILGALALVLFLWGVGFLIYLFATFDLPRQDEGGDPARPINWQQIVMVFSSISFTAFAIVGVIGAVQMRQIPTRWWIATFCFCCELLFALMVIATSKILQNSNWFPGGYNVSQQKDITNTFVCVFVFSLIALAIFRPLALKVFRFTHDVIGGKKNH